MEGYRTGVKMREARVMRRKQARITYTHLHGMPVLEKLLLLEATLLELALQLLIHFACVTNVCTCVRPRKRPTTLHTR